MILYWILFRVFWFRPDNIVWNITTKQVEKILHGIDKTAEQVADHISSCYRKQRNITANLNGLFNYGKAAVFVLLQASCSPASDPKELHVDQERGIIRVRLDLPFYCPAC